MKILFYRYGSICEPSMLKAFQQLDITVVEETTEITNKRIAPAECVAIINNAINLHHPLFVFSINFFPAIAEVCHIHKIFYICQTVDAPVTELFSTAIQHDTNRIFLFDRAQYDYFKPFNPKNIFHLPLAADTDHFDAVVQTITEADTQRFSSDISFVGSLYNEKNPLNELSLSDYSSGYIAGLVNSALELYGYNPIEDALSMQVLEEILPYAKERFNITNTVTSSDKYIVSHCYIGMQAAETERIRTLNRLAEEFRVDLYTRSNTNKLKNVCLHGGIKTLTEMPKVFHTSKINLNMTIRPIQSGLPLRIFDILGCGGFLMTNYQSELDDHFEIGTDLEAYSSIEELVEKCHYYLKNEDIRKKIAQSGYQKVKNLHTYPCRLAEMLRTIISS